MKVFECFAGYGSTCFALKELGLEHDLVGFSEIDKYAVKCFEQNHGGKNFGDVTKIDWSSVPDFDLLTGGFPCQSFSTAGKQLGEQDARGVLGLELTKALIVKQPKYFLFENVKGFMSKRFTETREKFVKSWGDAGYKVQFKVLNTKNFGVPQNRERVWFVGIRKDIEQEFNFPKPFELKLKLKDVLEESVDAKYFASKRLIEGLKKSGYRERFPISVDSEVSQTLKIGGDVKRIFGCALRGRKNFDGNYDLNLEFNNEEVSNSLIQSQKESMVISHSLYPISGNPKQGGTGHLIKEDGSSYCLDSGNSQAVEYSNFIRRLTPKECFRLQGFLKDQINLEGLSDTQCYKLAGNGQSINVVALILKELLMQDKTQVYKQVGS